MKIYDTLAGGKRDFAPASGEVRMYVCGVTPYAPSHVGHAMSYVVFDVIRRYLEYLDYGVRHVQNFTDLDDKIIERAAQAGTSVEELAERFIAEYFRDMDRLNVQKASVYPRASQEIPKMVELIQSMIGMGTAYAANGDVYFRVTKDPSYGKLSHRSLDTMRAGARVESSEQKEHPMDFTLWKAAKPGEPVWQSPWGPGRPGWHIECSAMALRYLGNSVDIHGGGQDLVFPHHENEIAQSEAVSGGEPFVRFWVHNGLLHLDQEKMSKSLGNMITVQEALSRYSADALRLCFLSSHYRSPGTYSDEGVAGAERAMGRLRQAANLAGPEQPTGALDAVPYRQRFLEAMEDDFNTPRALAAFFDLAREVNREAEEGHSVADAQTALLELGRSVLGLTFAEPAVEVTDELAVRVQALVDQRAELRNSKRFAEADAVRDELAALHVTLTDTPGGTEWQVTSS